MSSDTAWAVPDLTKALAILSEIAFRRSAWEPFILGTGEKSHFSSSQKSYTLITTFSNVLPYHRKKTNRMVVDSWSNGLVVKTLDSQSKGPVLKSTG